MLPVPLGASQMMPPGFWGISLSVWDSLHVSPVSTHSLVTTYTPQHLLLHVCRTQQSDVIGCHVCLLYCPDTMYVQGYVCQSRVVVTDSIMSARTAGGVHPHIFCHTTTTIVCVFVKIWAAKTRSISRLYTLTRHFHGFILSTSAKLRQT